jgi:hypothetical protein
VFGEQFLSSLSNELICLPHPRCPRGGFSRNAEQFRDDALEPAGVTRDVELLRERWLFEHPTPDSRSIVLEFVVRNNSRQTFYQLFLPLRSFLSGLHVMDEDGRVLNVLPNEEVRTVLKEVEDESPDTYRWFIDRFAKARYRICIVFPAESPLGPGEIRTIRLAHVDGVRPKHKFLSALKLPVYRIEHERLLSHTHGLFVDVQTPPDTHLSVTVGDAEIRGRNHYHVTPNEEIDHHFGAYLPPASTAPYSWFAEYWLGPTKVDSIVLSLWLAFSTVAGIWLALDPFSTSSAASLTAIAGGLLATSSALVFGLRKSWADRYRLLLIPSILFTALGWLRWSGTL